MSVKTYNVKDFGGKIEEEMMRLFRLQRDDARNYFLNCIKPRLDRSYKLYIADNSDRSKEIKKWQANVVVPYINAVVETLKPRILDARPDFTVQGRNEDDHQKANKIQNLCDYTWEKSSGDKVAESLTSSSLVYGTGFMQVSWKLDKRTHEFLSTKDLGKKKYKWEKREQVFYDAPYFEWVDNYELWYDWHNIDESSKQYWFKRKVLTEDEIRRKYPMADPKRLEVAFARGNAGILTDYASIRSEVKFSHEKITKGSDYNMSSWGTETSRYQNNSSVMKMYEVFEWWRPFDDKYAVIVAEVPILGNMGCFPNPYDFKEAPFIGVPYLRIPGEYEGYGLPMLLENPQIMLNMIKNQRLDAMTLSIHKSWIVNPLANINKAELVARPMAIIYSSDPNGAREVQSSDIKPSAYKEEELLKGDMRYSSGVDDFSMGSGGGSPSATEVRHLRESTLERVRLFVNHLGEAYGKLMRFNISLWRQFGSKEMVIRITGDNGEIIFPLIEKDDLMGEFDLKATVIPAIAGGNDIKKKQDMDLFQLLIGSPSIDPVKLISKILYDWGWDIESIKAEQAPVPPTGVAPGQGDVGQTDMLPSSKPMPMLKGKGITPDVASQVMDLIGMNPANSSISEMKNPVNLLNNGGNVPPTPAGVPNGAKTTNPRGMNRKPGSKVNTTIPNNNNHSAESQLLNRVGNIQR